MEKWEYYVIYLPEPLNMAVQELNRFGKDGWECFNIVTEVDDKKTYFRTFFKRRLP